MFYSISNDNQHVSFIALIERVHTIYCNGGFKLYKNKASNGRNNISGLNIRRLRLAMPQKTSQRLLAYWVQLKGLDLDKNAIQRIESGDRFVTDIELKVFTAFFGVSTDELLRIEANYIEKQRTIPMIHTDEQGLVPANYNDKLFFFNQKHIKIQAGNLTNELKHELSKWQLTKFEMLMLLCYQGDLYEVFI